MKPTAKSINRFRLACLSGFLLTLFIAGTAHGVELTSRFAQFDDARVHYRTAGRGEQALIFVHGWACNAGFWRRQTAAFPSVRVIAVDLPGHGRSDKPHVEYTIDYLARSIAAVMDDAGVKRAVLVGHSMGAPVVGQFHRLYPQRTLGLVIVDGAMGPFISRAEMDQLLSGLVKNYLPNAEQMIDGMLAPIEDPKLKDEIRNAMLSTPGYVAISALRGLADEDAYQKREIKVPALAVLAKSHNWPADTETFLRTLFPQLELYMWNDVSHFLMMEKPKEFNRALRAFLLTNKLLTK